ADEVALRRIVEGAARVFGDGEHRNGDAGRIGERKIALGRHRLGGDDFELSGPALAMKLERFLVGECGPRTAAFLVGHRYSSTAARPEADHSGARMSGSSYWNESRMKPGRTPIPAFSRAKLRRGPVPRTPPSPAAAPAARRPAGRSPERCRRLRPPSGKSRPVPMRHRPAREMAASRAPSRAD